MKFIALFFSVFLCAISCAAQSLEQSYQLYESGGVYYLKADPTWVPIHTNIFVIIPIYGDGQVLKLEKNNGSWVAESVSFSEFNTTNPSLLGSNPIQYVDANVDGHMDIRVALGGSDGTVNLLNDGTSSSFTASPYKRRVIFIHTDLLGSPAAESDQNGDLL